MKKKSIYKTQRKKKSYMSLDVESNWLKNITGNMFIQNDLLYLNCAIALYTHLLWKVISADLSLCWWHKSYCRFSHGLAQIVATH